jgi:Prp8 binding protein
MVWDVEEGTRVRKLAGHSRIVNAVAAAAHGPPLLVSASDDGSLRVWDARSKHCVLVLPGQFPALACAFAADGHSVFGAGVEGCIRQFDLRRSASSSSAGGQGGGGGAEGEEEEEDADMEERGSRAAAAASAAAPLLVLQGHSEAVLSLSLSPAGTHLLSFALDNTVRAWDVRSFVAPGTARCSRTFVGSVNNFESNLIRCDWSADGELVACGSADRTALVWDYETAAVQARLGGHGAPVTQVAFRKGGAAEEGEVSLATAGTDKKIFWGPI